MDDRGNEASADGIDEAIHRPEEDRLDRSEFARAVARQVMSAPAGSGHVIGVIGPWGDGKTSVLNLAAWYVRELDRRAIVMRFNPWLFEGTEHLVSSFLGEMGGVLYKELRLGRRGARRLDQLIVKYAGLLGRRGEALSDIRGRGTVHGARAEIATYLRRIDKRVVVLIDDLDRLMPDEIREVMRLVKLVADFPNTVFVLAFDRKRVAHALGETFSGEPGERDREGQAYLEKIVQVAAELPALPAGKLVTLLNEDLVETLARLGRPVPRSDRWTRAVNDVIGKRVKTLRDVRRYLASVTMTIEIVGDELDLTDVLALEAVRIFTPSQAAAILDNAFALTRYTIPGLDHDDTRKAGLTALVEAAQPHSESMRAVIRLLFPTADALLSNGAVDRGDIADWRRDRRVAVDSNLLYYFSRSRGPDEVANAMVASVLEALGDRKQLDGILTGLKPEQLGALVYRMRDHVEALTAANAEIVAAAFLGVSGRLPPMRPRSLGMDAMGQLVGLVGASLAQIGDGDRPAAYERLFSAAPLSGAWLMVSSTKPDATRSARLVPSAPNALWERLREAFEDRLISADAATLSRQPHLPELFDVMVSNTRGPGRLKALGSDDEFFTSLLKALVVMTYEDEHELTLPWKPLLDAFGRRWLEQRAMELKTSGFGESHGRDVVDVLDHYLSTEKPLPVRPQ